MGMFDLQSLQALQLGGTTTPSSAKPTLVEGGVGTGKTTHFIETAKYGNTFIVVPTRRAVAGKIRGLQERYEHEGAKFPMRVASNLTDDDGERFVFGPTDARKVYLTTPEGMARYRLTTDLTHEYDTFVFDEVHVAHSNVDYANLILRFLSQHRSTPTFFLSATYDEALVEMFVKDEGDGSRHADLRQRTWDYLKGLDVDRVHIDDLRSTSFRRGFDFKPKLVAEKFPAVLEAIVKDGLAGLPTRIACFSATSGAAFLRELGVIDDWKIGVMGTSEWVEKVRIATGGTVEFTELSPSSSVAHVFKEFNVLIHSPALNAGADIYDHHRLWVIDRIGSADSEGADDEPSDQKKEEDAQCGHFTLGDIYQIGGRLRAVAEDLPFSTDEYCHLWYGSIPKTPWMKLVEENIDFYLEDNRWLKLRSPTINSALRNGFLDGTASFKIATHVGYRDVTLTWPKGKFLGHDDPDCQDEVNFSESIIQVYRVVSGVKSSQTLDYVIEEAHGRVYEALIKSSKNIRRAVSRWLRPHGWQLIDVDIESAHPNFLLSALGIDADLGSKVGERVEAKYFFNNPNVGAGEVDADGYVSPKFALITAINGAQLPAKLFEMINAPLNKHGTPERYATQVEAALALTYPSLDPLLTPEVRDDLLKVTQRYRLHARKHPYKFFSSVEYDMRKAIAHDIRQVVGSRSHEVFFTPSHDGVLVIAPRDLCDLSGYRGSVEYKNWKLSSLWLRDEATGLRQEVKVNLAGSCRWRRKSLHLGKGKWQRPDFADLGADEPWTWHKKGRARGKAVGKAKNAAYVYVRDGKMVTEAAVQEEFKQASDGNFSRWYKARGYEKCNIATAAGRQKYEGLLSR